MHEDVKRAHPSRQLSVSSKPMQNSRLRFQGRRGVLHRYETWFTGLWEPRVGAAAARLNYRVAVLNVASMLSVVIITVASAVGYFVPSFRSAVLPLDVLWGGSIAFIRWKAGRVRVQVRTAAALHLSYDGDLRKIPTDDVGRFDRWLRRSNL